MSKKQYLNRYKDRINHNLPPQRVLSLFTGMGGDLLSLDMQGYPIEEIYFADINKPSQRFIKHLYPSAKLIGQGSLGAGDIRLVTDDLLKHLKPTYINNSFPCQKLSRIGKRDGICYNIPETGELSSSDLFWAALDIMKRAKDLDPSVKIMTENVANLPSFDKDDPRIAEGYIGYLDWITDMMNKHAGQYNKFDSWVIDPQTLVPVSMPRTRTFWTTENVISDYFKRKKDWTKETKKPEDFKNWSKYNRLRAFMNILNLDDESDFEDFNPFEYNDKYADIADKDLLKFGEESGLWLPYNKRLGTIVHTDKGRILQTGEVSEAYEKNLFEHLDSNLWQIRQTPDGRFQVIRGKTPEAITKKESLQAQGFNVAGPRYRGERLVGPARTNIMKEGKSYDVTTPSVTKLTALSGFEPKLFADAIKKGIITKQDALGFLGNGYNANVIMPVLNATLGQGFTMFDKNGKPLNLSDYRCKTRIKNIRNDWIDKEYNL